MRSASGTNSGDGTRRCQLSSIRACRGLSKPILARSRSEASCSSDGGNPAPLPAGWALTLVFADARLLNGFDVNGLVLIARDILETYFRVVSGHVSVTTMDSG